MCIYACIYTYIYIYTPLPSPISQHGPWEWSLRTSWRWPHFECLCAAHHSRWPDRGYCLLRSWLLQGGEVDLVGGWVSTPLYMDNLWIIYISGWWLSHPSEKYESQLGWLFPAIWKNIKCSKPPTSRKPHGFGFSGDPSKKDWGSSWDCWFMIAKLW